MSPHAQSQDEIELDAAFVVRVNQVLAVTGHEASMEEITSAITGSDGVGLPIPDDTSKEIMRAIRLGALTATVGEMRCGQCDAQTIEFSMGWPKVTVRVQCANNCCAGDQIVAAYVRMGLTGSAL